jgi:hypothetical protein
LVASPEQVPAPQLASAAGFGAAARLAVGFFFGGVDAAAVLADAAGAAESVAAGVAEAAGAVAAAAVVAGAVAGVAAAFVAGAGDSAAGAVAFPPHPFDEQDACAPAGAWEAAGFTSLACTGCGWLPPQATMALVPMAASTALRFSIDRFGRMTRFSL